MLRAKSVSIRARLFHLRIKIHYSLCYTGANIQPQSHEDTKNNYNLNLCVLVSLWRVLNILNHRSLSSIPYCQPLSFSVFSRREYCTNRFSGSSNLGVPPMAIIQYKVLIRSIICFSMPCRCLKINFDHDNNFSANANTAIVFLLKKCLYLIRLVLKTSCDLSFRNRNLLKRFKFFTIAAVSDSGN